MQCGNVFVTVFATTFLVQRITDHMHANREEFECFVEDDEPQRVERTLEPQLLQQPDEEPELQQVSSWSELDAARQAQYDELDF